MAEMTYQLSDSNKEFIAGEIARLHLPDPNAYVQHLIAIARGDEAQRQLEREVLSAISSGPPVVADDAFWARRRQEMIHRHTRSKAG